MGHEVLLIKRREWAYCTTKVLLELLAASVTITVVTGRNLLGSDLLLEFNDMEAETFHYSEKQAQLFKRTCAVLAFAIPLAFFLFVQIGPMRGLLDTSISLIVTVAIFVLMAVLLAVAYRFRYDTLKNTEIVLTSEGLEQRVRGKTESFPYNQINRLVIHSTRQGETALIQLEGEPKSLAIVAMENMERLATQLANHVASDKVQRKLLRLDGRNPITLAAIILLTFIVLALLFQLVNLEALYSFFFLFLGFSFLLGKSKFLGSRQRARPREIVFGLVAIGIGLFNLATQAYLGGFTGPCSFIGKYVEQSGCIYSLDDGSWVAFMPDSRRIVWDDLRTVAVEPATWWGWSQRKFFRHDDYLAGFALSPDGALIASWTLYADGESKLWLWNVEEESLIRQHPLRNSQLVDVAFSADSHTLALAYADQIELWEVNNWRPISTVAGFARVAFSRDGQTILTPSQDGLTLWRVVGGAEIGDLERPVGAGFTQSVAFAPGSGRLTASLTNGNVYLWQGIEDTQPEAWPYEGGSTSNIAFSSDGRLFAIGYRSNQDNTQGYIQLRQVNDGSVVKEFELGRASTQFIAFSPDSRLLAVATGNETMVFELAKIISR